MNVMQNDCLFKGKYYKSNQEWGFHLKLVERRFVCRHTTGNKKNLRYVYFCNARDGTSEQSSDASRVWLTPFDSLLRLHWSEDQKYICEDVEEFSILFTHNPSLSVPHFKYPMVQFTLTHCLTPKDTKVELEGSITEDGKVYEDSYFKLKFIGLKYKTL